MLDRRTVCLLMLLSLGTMPVPVWAEVHSISATGEHRMGDHDSLEDARRLAFLNAKTLAVEQAVQYLAELPAVKQLGLNADELRAYGTGLLEINEYPHDTATQGPRTAVSVLAKSSIDPSIVAHQLELLMRNERAKVELTRARDKIDGYRKAVEADTQRLAASTDKSDLQTIAQHRRDVLSFIDTEEQMARTWSALVGAEEMRHPGAAPGKEAGKHKKTQPQPAQAGAPDNAEEHRKKGALLNAQGNYDAAIPEFRQALRLMPDLTRAHFGLGEALQGKGDLDGAMAEYKTVLSRYPDDPDTHTSMGTLLQKKGDLDGAIAEYRTALRQRPDDALTHFNLGTALSTKGQVEAAVTEYRTAIRLNPDLVEAYFDLGSLLKANAQPKEAADAFREYVKRAPNTPANKQWIEQAQAFLTETAEERRHQRR
jgi:tetratricopeptide (TPR) repeat protein